MATTLCGEKTDSQSTTHVGRLGVIQVARNHFKCVKERTVKCPVFTVLITHPQSSQRAELISPGLQTTLASHIFRQNSAIPRHVYAQVARDHFQWTYSNEFLPNFDLAPRVFVSRVELNARAEAGSSYAKMLLAAKSNFINVEMLIDQLKSVTTRKESLCLQRRIVAQCATGIRMEPTMANFPLSTLETLECIVSAMQSCDYDALLDEDLRICHISLLETRRVPCLDVISDAIEQHPRSNVFHRFRSRLHGISGNYEAALSDASGHYCSAYRPDIHVFCVPLFSAQKSAVRRVWTRSSRQTNI